LQWLTFSFLCDLAKESSRIVQKSSGIAGCFRLLHREKGPPAEGRARAVHLKLGMPLNSALHRTASAVLHRAIGLFRSRVLARRELRAYAIRI